MTSNSRPTIADVARRAEVSKASVSRYLNGIAGNLSHATAERIELAIRELDFRPNAWARSLKTQRSGLVAAVVTDLKNPYVTALLGGLENTLGQSGLSVLIASTGHDPRQEERILSKLIDQRVEGIVLQPATTTMQQVLKTVIDRGISVVLVDRVLDDYALPMVGLDNVNAIELALNHLWERGYRQLLYVTEPSEQASSRRERETAVLQHGSAWRFVKELTLRDDDRVIEDGLHDYIRAYPCCSAVLCSNSITALHVIQSFSALRLSVPEVGLATIDDPAWASYILGGVTAIRQPTEEIGRAAAEMLMHPHTPVGQVRFTAQILARASTALTP